MNSDIPAIELSREAMLAELLSWANSFIDRSKEWRKSSFETQWQRWARAADSIYDPEVAAKKEAWQSKAVVPITASHRENAQAQLFKTEVGPRPPFDVKARDGIVPPEQVAPGADQSKNIKDLILRERERARYELNRNRVLEDKTTYGSGFARIRFETKYEDRKVIVPDFEEPSVFDPGSIMRAMSNQQIQIGQHEEIREQVIFRGIRFEHLSIWDVFPDPQSVEIGSNAIAYRYNLTYGEVVAGAEAGYYLPEAVAALKDRPSEDVTPEDKQRVESDRQIAESKIQRTPYQANLICYELYARLPKKWVLINGEEIDNPDKLIPAVIRFHKDSIVAVELNPAYDGNAPIYKDDYMPVAGQFYGRGIPEMLKDVQLVANETVNQRLDSASIVLDPMFVVLEKFVSNPNDLNQSRAGGVVRIKIPTGSNINDIRAVFMRMDKGTIDRASFIEPQEWERYAQERTSITQTSLGTEDNTDTTLGAQKIQKGVTGDKLAYIGMLSEFDFQYDVFRAFWKLIYQNYTPDDYALALGPERAATIVPMTPEQLENSYQYYPLGIFEMESKARLQSQIAGWVGQFGTMPWANILGAAKEELRVMDIDEKKLILPEADAMQVMAKAEMMAQGMAEQIVAQESAANPPAQGSA